MLFMGSKQNVWYTEVNRFCQKEVTIITEVARSDGTLKSANMTAAYLGYCLQEGEDDTVCQKERGSRKLLSMPGFV